MTGLFGPLLPACARVAEADPAAGRLADLHPVERAAVAAAVPSRQREFATGRRLAHRLLDGLGLDHGPLAPNPDRSPAWPEGVVGSITHCPTLLAVAVARAAEVAALGIDVEPLEPLPDGLEPLVLSPAEAREADRLPRTERALRGRWVFSAKEAVYKAIYPLSGRVLDFDDVRITWGDPGAFVASLQRQVPPFPPGASLAGRHAHDGAHLAAAVTVPKGL